MTGPAPAAPPRTRSRTTLRTEIQALRAIAVSAVIIVHIWPQVLTGGFIGVDIFFVISGYLITAHLLREIDLTGTVKLSHFWARRVRRLLPAAFTVLLFSLVVALVLLPWSAWLQNLKEIAASALYVQNWALAADAVDYFAAENDPTLAQHFWSLSVEEQFYLVWPLLMLAAIWAGNRFSRDAATRRRAILFALIGIFLSSFAASIIWTEIAPASAYFSTVTRAWEFAVGGLLVFVRPWSATGRRALDHGSAHLTASWGGLALIAVALVTYDGATPFPGYTALLPVLGTAAIIWAGESNVVGSPTAVGRLAPIQWVGDVSYSAYLWHWPFVLMYEALRGYQPGLVGGVAILAATFAVAWLSKKLIEDPFRTHRAWSARSRSYGFAASGMAVITVTAVVATAMINARIPTTAAPAEAFASVEALQDEVDATLRSSSWQLPDQLPGKSAQVREWVEDDCIRISTRADEARCTYGNLESDLTLVVIGDSYATHFLPAIRSGFGDTHRIIPLTLDQCPIANVVVQRSSQGKPYDACVAHNDRVLERVAEITPDLLVVSDSTPSTIRRMLGDLTRAERMDAYVLGATEAYDEIERLGVEDVVVLESPPLTNCSPENAPGSPRQCRPASGADADLRAVQLEKIGAASAAGFDVVDFTPWVCSDDGICPELIGDALVRADGSHLSDSFSRRIGPLLEEEITGQ